MKVIKKGKNSQNWPRKLYCTGKGFSGNGCGSLLLIEESDLVSAPFPYIRCPECGFLTEIVDHPKPSIIHG